MEKIARMTLEGISAEIGISRTTIYTAATALLGKVVWFTRVNFILALFSLTVKYII